LGPTLASQSRPYMEECVVADSGECTGSAEKVRRLGEKFVNQKFDFRKSILVIAGFFSVQSCP
jgi:hypothetical protein